MLELLRMKLSMNNKGWPRGKGCKLISKPHPRHTQESSQIHYKNNCRDFSNSYAYVLGT